MYFHEKLLSETETVVREHWVFLLTERRITILRCNAGWLWRWHQKRKTTSHPATGPKISKYTGFHEWLFSDDLFPAGVVTFHQQTLACVQAEVFMGLWQLLAAAEVLRCTTWWCVPCQRLGGSLQDAPQEDTTLPPVHQSLFASDVV